MVGFNMDGPARDRVLQLIQEKDRIEYEIRDHTAILETNHVGMHDSLIDAEGFPRNDIDVYKVRHARHQIICLQNDHKAIMKRIEQGLAEVHSGLLGTEGQGSSAQTPSLHMNGNGANHHNGHAPTEPVQGGQVFAKVAFVQEGSPADDAGLSAGDEIIQFGSINSHNFTDMLQIHEVVTHSVGQRVQVRVKRAPQSVLNFTVVPRPWAQPGLLGCQINRVE